jgi:hypothetical protein
MKHINALLASSVKILRSLRLPECGALPILHAALLLTPLMATGAATESNQPVQQAEVSGPGKAALEEAAEYQSKGFNVLFIAIDDQNDWIGHLGGHPLAKTPNLDRLASRGTTFLNAHCNAPLCNPSRTSLLLGLRPTTTGVYGLSPSFRALPKWKNRVSLPQHFSAHGYKTLSGGKIFHHGGGGEARKGAAAAEWSAPEFQVLGKVGGIGAKPPSKLTLLSGPEGGLSAEEEAWALAKGFVPVHLGARVLRDETAPLAVLAQLL